MRVAFCQFNPIFGAVAVNLSRIEALLAETTAELVVLPELCTSGYLFTERAEVEAVAEGAGTGPTAQRLSKLCQAKGLSLVYGYPEREGDTLYNSAALITPAGVIGNYRKIHLFNTEQDFFAQGNLGFKVWSVNGINLGLMVCFDWFFPEAMRVLTLHQADIICHPANLVLPYCQRAMVTRCLENAVFAITANRTGTETRGGQSFTYTGGSQIVDPQGAIITQASATAELVSVVEIDPRRARNKAIGLRNDRLRNRSPRDYELLTRSD